MKVLKVVKYFSNMSIIICFVSVFLSGQIGCVLGDLEVFFHRRQGNLALLLQT